MRVRAIDLVDVLAYLVVLGIFIQLLPGVLSETFLLALFTAILLKIVLEAVLRIKKKIVGGLRSADTRIGRIVGAVALLMVMAGSKFVVLELTALAFGDSVQLGGFFAVTALILTLMLARHGTRLLVGYRPDAYPGNDRMDTPINGDTQQSSV
ncbi:hypothetical protein [Millisia brevis]|uniref:hypothetical protein n=1 Tax=Millisia brevis TaxID=264148 RepID=UPI000B031223|nr:hypothetical protein [Millisia brevis]